MFVSVFNLVAWWALPFLFVLTVIVTIHELGHFLAAKSFGVAIERFSVGFGRAIFSRRDRSGVEWRIGWLPLGGYVMFAGDENVASVPDEQDLDALRQDIVAREGRAAVNKYLVFKPLWQRAIVAAAGPAANFLLSIAVFAVLAMTFGETVAPAKVGQVMPGSAAQAAGIQPGDLVLSIAGRKVDGFEDIAPIVSLRAGVPVTLVVQRGAQRLSLTATPRVAVVKDLLDRDQRIGQLGLESEASSADFVFHRYGPIAAIGRGVVRTWQVVDSTGYYLGRLVRGQVSVDQLGGPLRTAQLAHALATAGAGAGHTFWQQTAFVFGNLLSGIAVISVGIGILNLLPIPTLDGGHLLFYAYEAAARRPLDGAVQAVGYRLGLALVVGLMLFLTANDLRHSSLFHFVGGLFS